MFFMRLFSKLSRNWNRLHFYLVKPITFVLCKNSFKIQISDGLRLCNIVIYKFCNLPKFWTFILEWFFRMHLQLQNGSTQIKYMLFLVDLKIKCSSLRTADKMAFDNSRLKFSSVRPGTTLWHVYKWQNI